MANRWAMALEAIDELRARVDVLENELRFLRRGKPRADADSCDTLLGYIHDEFHDRPWTALTVIQAAMDNPPLLGAVKRCLGGKPSVYKLALFLTRCLDHAIGAYRLQCIEDHSRDGRVFLVTGPVTRSQKHRAMVASGNGGSYE